MTDPDYAVQPRDLAEVVGHIPIREMEKQDLFDALADGFEWTFSDPFSDSVERKAAPPLLRALREAVFGGMERTGGTTGFTARLPIAAGALDLYETVDMEIAEAWACLFPGQVPNADAPERLLAQIVAVAGVDEEVTVTVATQRVERMGSRDEHWWVERTPTAFTVEALLRRWVRQIAELFDPPRMADISHPCLQCGEEWAWKVVAGESVPYRVFVFVRDSRGNSIEARCLSCGVSWGRDMFLWIAQEIGGNLDARLED